MLKIIARSYMYLCDNFVEGRHVAPNFIHRIYNAAERHA